MNRLRQKPHRDLMRLFILNLALFITYESSHACSAEGKNLIQSIEQEITYLQKEIESLQFKIDSQDLTGWALHVAKSTRKGKIMDEKNAHILLQKTKELTQCG